MCWATPKCKAKEKIVKDNQSLTVYYCEECDTEWSQEKKE